MSPSPVRRAGHVLVVGFAVIGALTLLTLTAVIVWIGVDNARATDRERARQGALAPFYTPPDPIPAGEPGTLLRTAPLGQRIPHGTGTRILYLTEGADGSRRVASGMVFVPDTPAPAEGRPVVSWAHPTVGMGDACAPSRTPNVLNDMPWLGFMLQNGWVVTATDYAGLGTPGTEAYLVGVAEANDVLNAVRAARELDGTAAGTRFALWGHSQGGQAVLFAADRAATYAPELELVAAAAAAPAAELVPLIDLQWRSAVAWVIGPEVSIAWPARYPGLDLDLDILTEVGRRRTESVAHDCLLGAALEAVTRQRILGEGYYAENPAEDPAWRAALEANTPSPLAPGVPLLVAQGLKDEVVLPPTTALLAQRSCDAGTDLTMLWMGDTGHDKAAWVSGPTAAVWLAERFAGVPTHDTCAVPLPVAPAASG